MRRSIRVTGLAVVVALGMGGNTARAQDGHDAHRQTAGGENTSWPTCPVSDEPIDLRLGVSSAEGSIFFCRPRCVVKFEENPDEYAGKVAAQRRALAKMPKIQASCPVTGNPVDTEVFVEQDGQRILLCCKSCADKFREDLEKYRVRLANSYSYQTKCVLEGGSIDPAVFATLADGFKVFFCCNGCREGFLKNPVRYAPRLEQMGIRTRLGEPASARMGGTERQTTPNQRGSEHSGHRSAGEGREGHGHRARCGDR